MKRRRREGGGCAAGPPWAGANRTRIGHEVRRRRGECPQPLPPDQRSGHARMVSASARRESARLAKAVSAARKTAPPRRWSVRGAAGETKARRLSTQGCWIGAGSASGDRRRPDPPDRRTAFRGGVGYEHECSRRLPLLRCPPLMMIISGGKSLPTGFEDGSAIDAPAGLGAGRRRERGFQRGKLKGGSRAGGRGGWDGGAVRRTGGEPVGCASGERGPRRRGGGVSDGRTAGSRTDGGPSAGSAWL